MAQAPDGDDILTVDDAVDILDEMLPAQTKSYELGLKLLPHYIVEAIHSKDLSPEKYLLKILIAFLQQRGKLRPTWRVIVDALRSRAVGCSDLANEVEAAHFPNPTALRERVSETAETAEAESNVTPEQPLEPTTRAIETSIHDEVAHQPLDVPVATEKSVAVVRREIDNFQDKFDDIRESTIKLLEGISFAVLIVAYALTAIKTLEEHKLFLKSNYEKIHSFKTHRELFGWLNFYWNYLAPDLLHQLLKKLKKEESSFFKILQEMEMYQKNLAKFRISTTLDVFCDSEPYRSIDPPPDFRLMVIKHKWPPEVTLQVIEVFRQRLLQTYDLKECALMVQCVRKGSFEVTWFIHISVVELLRKKQALNVFNEFNVTRVEIYTLTSTIVYQPSTPGAAHDSHMTDSSATSTTEKRVLSTMEDDYPFIEKPTPDFYCPVTCDILLQPHLTSCCGNHLSQEAAERIQGEGGVCPLCKEKRWSTMLDKWFQRQVNSLRVFCGAEERGCRWQGELASYQSHMKSCSMAEDFMRTELVEMSSTAVEASSSMASQQSHVEVIVPVKVKKGSAIGTYEDEDHYNSKPLLYSSADEVRQHISELQVMFFKLKSNTRDCLEKRKIIVKKVADALVSISADEEEQHKLFLESHFKVLFRATNIQELFGTMNFHWNYLNPSLLDHLVHELKLEEVKSEMKSYKSELQRFLKQTPLTLFCRTQRRRRLSLTPEFREMVAEFDWPHAMQTLEIVEQFRQEYASQYNLRDCAMMVAQIHLG